MDTGLFAAMILGYMDFLFGPGEAKRRLSNYQKRRRLLIGSRTIKPLGDDNTYFIFKLKN